MEFLQDCICIFAHNIYVRYINHTALSKHFWQLINCGNTQIIMWDTVAKTKSYNGKADRCNLCHEENLKTLK